MGHATRFNGYYISSQGSSTIQFLLRRKAASLSIRKKEQLPIRRGFYQFSLGIIIRHR